MVAGAISITVNTLALKLADFVPLATAHGGLLRLIKPLFPEPLAALSGSPTFQTVFHLTVGLLMALAYAYVVEPLLRFSAWAKGFLYALAAWLLNALLVLPATGEGFAGSRHLSLAGMILFAAAHTLFFVGLAIMYSWLRSGGDRGTMQPSGTIPTS